MDERGDLEPISAEVERSNGRARGTRDRAPAIAVMSIAVVGLIVIGLNAGSEDDKASLDGTTPGTASAFTTTTAPLPTTVPWRRLDAPALQRNVTTPIWTGSELIVWSPEDRSVFRLSPGVRGSFSPLPEAPLARPRRVAAAVWTGHEVLAWAYSATQLVAGYDPAAGTWRQLPRPPLSARRPLAALWSGTEFIVWGDLDGAGARDGAAYEPVTDQWRLLSPAPMTLNEGTAVWTGEEMIVVGARLDALRYAAAPTAVIAYNPMTDQWRELGSVDLAPQATWAVWAGDRIVAWDYDLQAREWTPAQGWRRLDDIPLHRRECYPRGVVAGETILMTYCDQAAVLRPGGTWEPIAVPGTRIYTAVVAGEDIMLWTDRGAWALPADLIT